MSISKLQIYILKRVYGKERNTVGERKIFKYKRRENLRGSGRKESKLLFQLKKKFDF